MQPYSFDLHRIFFGDFSPLFLVEIAFRTTILFVYTLGMLRLVGHRGLGQLSVAEFALIIAMGSAVGDPMFYADIPLVHGMVVIMLIVAFQRFVNGLTLRNRTIARVVDGIAHRIVVDGKLDPQGMDSARLTEDEIYAELRQAKVEYLSQVRRAYLESDGKVSVFLFDKSQRPPDETSLLAQIDETMRE